MSARYGRVVRASLLLALPMLVSTLSASEPMEARDAEVVHAWERASLSLFKESHRAFATHRSRESRLGYAITLLIQQPKTAGNLDEAVRILESLIIDIPTGEVAVVARFHLGRVEQIHRSPPNLSAAAAHFSKLVAEHPAHPWAEQAAIKLALIELYAPVSADELRTRFENHRRAAAGLVTASARRDLNLLLADVALRFGLGDALALEHLMAADLAGIARPTQQARVWVQIGELARLLGRTEIARDHYGKFLTAFTRDVRRRMVLEHLASLPPAAIPAP